MHFASEASKYACMRTLHAQSPRNSLRLFTIALSDKHNIHINRELERHHKSAFVAPLNRTEEVRGSNPLSSGCNPVQPGATPLLLLLCFPISAAAGRADTEDISSLQVKGAFSGKRNLLSISDD